MMKSVFVVLFFVCFLLQPPSFAQEEKLFDCRDPDLGIRFKCSPKWQVGFEDNAFFFVISEDPEVMLTVVREPSSFISLSELTTPRLKNLGQYADGFQQESITLNGLDAIRVKAFDKNSSDIRLTDIYLINKGYFYKILFSVAPRNEWDRYQFLLRDILREFSFIEDDVALKPE